GTVVFSNDAGRSFRVVQSGTKETLNSISFVDQRVGFSVGSAGVVLITADGGLTWKDAESPTQNNLFAVQAFGKRGAFVIGEGGIFLFTEDGGTTWLQQATATSRVLQAIAFRGGDRLWIAGRGGLILKRSEPLSPGPHSSPNVPPVLVNRSGQRPRPRKPALRVTDDDIPLAVPKSKP
ncbi:MAG: hypothetical protein H0X08_00830, partial [Blastocatellia bacterium]|nr:hypothetical protein [Blastocatellia bacterium]